MNVIQMEDSMYLMEEPDLEIILSNQTDIKKPVPISPGGTYRVFHPSFSNEPITSDDYWGNDNDNDNDDDKNAIIYEPDYTSISINTDLDNDSFLRMLMDEKVKSPKKVREEKESIEDNESVYEEHDVDIDTRFAKSNKEGSDIYKKPPRNSVSARHIWKVAGLGEEACMFQIELHLVDWANKYAKLTTDNFNITQIQWKCKKTSTSYTTSWGIFLKWMLCSCSNTTV